MACGIAPSLLPEVNLTNLCSTVPGSTNPAFRKEGLNGRSGNYVKAIRKKTQGTSTWRRKAENFEKSTNFDHVDAPEHSLFCHCVIGQSDLRDTAYSVNGLICKNKTLYAF